MIISKKRAQIYLALLLLCICAVFQNSSILSVAILILLFYVAVVGFSNQEIIVLFIMLFTDYGCGLLPQNISLLFFNCSTSDLAIILLIWLLVSKIFHESVRIKIDMKTIIVILMILIFVIYSAVIASSHVEQSLFVGLFTQRRLVAFCFLPLLLNTKNQDIFVQDIKNAAIKASVFAMVIYGIQYILLYVNGTMFLTCAVSSRILVRLHIYPRTFQILFIILLSYIYLNKAKFKHYTLLLLILFYCAVIGQYRMMTMGCVVIVAIAFFVGKSSNTKMIMKVFLALIIVISIPIILFGITYLTEGMEGAVTSAAVRNNASVYYSKLLNDCEMFGYGSINNTGGWADDILGTSYGFYLIDLGAFALKFMYGYIGYITYFVLLGAGIIYGLRIAKAKKNVTMLMLCIYSLITQATLLTPYYYSSSIILLLVVGFYKGDITDDYRSSRSKLQL